MRGFRFLGRVDMLSARDYRGSDMLFFSPSEHGIPFRGERGFRGRDFDLFSCQTAIATGACPSDYVFVATAIGEEIFDAEVVRAD